MKRSLKAFCERWRFSVCSLGILAVVCASPSLAAGAGADCNTNGFDDADDIAAGTSADCNGTGVPDDCELSSVVTFASGDLAPLAGGTPLSFVLDSPPLAISDVVLTFTAFGDLSTTDEFVSVSMDATTTGILFADGAADCPETADKAVWTVSSNAFNDAASNGEITIEILPTNAVDNTCTPTSSISVTVTYTVFRDCNANEIPDECEPDCNTNGIPDDCDIAAETAADCDLDGVPNTCETDCNTNGIPDDCDIADAESPDCDNNGVPDECDLATGEPDCNANDIPDGCDLTSGRSADCNANDVPDECELGVLDLVVAFRQPPAESTGIYVDADCKHCDPPGGQSAAAGFTLTEQTTIGTVNIWGGFYPTNVRPATDAFTVIFHEADEGLPGEAVVSFSDLPADRTATDVLLTSGVAENMFAITLPGGAILQEGAYFLEVFNDTTGSQDTFFWELGVSVSVGSIAGTPFSNEAPGETWLFASETNLAFELLAGTLGDCDHSGVPDDCEIEAAGADCNANDLLDICEPDCNANGSPDDCDVATGTSPDCNDNNRPDECDLESGEAADCNTNGLPDTCDISAGTAGDCDGNRVPDDCELASEDNLDCDANGVLDACQLDSDGDGVIDVCEPPDGDGDGVPDADDNCPTTPEGFEVDDSGCALLDIPFGFGCGAGAGASVAMLGLPLYGLLIELGRRRRRTIGKTPSRHRR